MIAVLFVTHELHEDVASYSCLSAFEPKFFARGAGAALLVDIYCKVIDGEAAFIALPFRCLWFKSSCFFKTWVA